jgi:lysozyme
MRRLSFLVLAGLIVVGCTHSASLHSASQQPGPDAGSYRIVQHEGKLFGIDVSHHNSSIDWSTLKSSRVDFIFIKATDGLNYLDPTFTANFKAAKDAGIVRGAYHFYESNDDGVAQAEWFIKNAQLEKGDLRPVVDIESLKAGTPDGDLHRNFKAFLARIEAHYGCTPIIYTGTRFWEHSMREHFPGRALWVAEYGVHTPKIPAEWQDWTFWQFSETYNLSGAPKPVDASYFNGEPAEFKSHLITETK